MSENLINSIQQLILMGKGDRGRLEYIIALLQSGKILPYSDQKYLEGIIPLYLGSSDNGSIQQHSERAIEELHKEIQTLNHKMSKLERKGFERYIGKKSIFFFLTLFVGWNALGSLRLSVLDPFVTGTNQYLFPLNVIANYFNAGSLVWFIFILMVLAWPFIGAIHLVNFIRTRKLANKL